MVQEQRRLAPDEIPEELLTLGGSELGEAISSTIGEGDPLAVGDLLEPLLRYSLVERDTSGRTWSVHRLVQAVMRESMGEAVGEWRERVVKALGRAFPWSEDPSTWQRCERLLRHVLTAVEEAEDSQTLAALLNSTASYLDDRARYAAAEPMCLRALTIWEQGEEHPDVATALNNLAILYRDQGRYDDAEPMYQRSLAIMEQVLGEEHPHTQQVCRNLEFLNEKRGGQPAPSATSPNLG